MNAIMAAPAAGAGFTPSWPYAQSMPLPSAILRPLQQPLYDTEIVASSAVMSERIFFQKQLGQADGSGLIAAKQDVHTNLQQPGQLANPLEFSLFGFLFEIGPNTTISDFTKMYTESVFNFTYTGNRTYLQIPMLRIPQGVSPEGFSSFDGATAARGSEVIHNGVGHISNIYKFTIGKSALRIRPTESFQAKVRWQLCTTGVGATFTAQTQMRCYLVGLSWNPL